MPQLGLFSKKSRSETHVEAWEPALDLSAYSAIVGPLVTVCKDPLEWSEARFDQLRDAWCRASDSPVTMEEALDYTYKNPSQPAFVRPWRWLHANASYAYSQGHWTLVADGAFWAHTWKNQLQPKFGQYEKTNFMVSSVPADVLEQLASLNEAAMSQLPPEDVLYGDATGQITVGAWMTGARGLLVD